jgi:hypothetical protein
VPVLFPNRMNRKKVKRKTGESKREGKPASFSSEEKEKGSSGKPELSGIHIISDQDIEGHFGKSDVEELARAKSKTIQAAERKTSSIRTDASTAIRRPKAAVNLQLEKQVWGQATEDAKRLGLEISRYVELALERYRNDGGKAAQVE